MEPVSARMTELLEEILVELRRQNALLGSHSKATLSISAAARLLGWDRHALAEAVAAGEVRSVPRGSQRRIPRAEIERLSQVGLPSRERAQAARAPRRRTRASVGEAIRALPLEEGRLEEGRHAGRGR